MKWIGQHIWSFISRFRNDVYLEATETGTIASGSNLGLDSNNKIVKSASPSGTIDLTSEVTGTLPVSSGGTGATTLADNSVLTGTGTSAISAESNLTFDGSTLTATCPSVVFEHSVSGQLTVKNTGNNTTPGTIKLENTRGGNAGQDGDSTGSIVFFGNNDAGSPVSHKFAEILASSNDVTADQEAGELQFKVAEFDGTVTTGLKLDGDTNANGEVDVIIGAGAASTTTIAGTLTMGSTAFVNNSGVVQVATQGTIDHDSLANFVANEHLRWDNDVSATATIHANNIPTLNQNTTGSAGTVATIAGLAPNTATTQATQPNITTMTGFVTGSSNELLTDDGDGTVTSESSLTYDSELLTIGDDDVGSSKILRRSHSDGAGGILVIGGGSATDGQSNMAGGDLQLNGGLGTGAAFGGAISFHTSNRGSTGTSINAAAKLAEFKAETTDTALYLYEKSGISDDDYLKIKVGEHGATDISTRDAAAMAAHLTLTVDGDITLDAATGVVRAGWHGSTTRIKILPRDFVANDGGRPAMIEDDSIGSNELFLFSFSSFDMFAYIPIPTGYKATHVRIYGSDTGQDFYVYEGDINSKTITDVATGSTSIGTEKTLGTQVTSDTTNYLIVRVTSDGATDEIHGGYVTIAAV
tara:strand:- start:139 stop:2064 length:1926 start_codon:yes stop_codon:yes gene_type:complete